MLWKPFILLITIHVWNAAGFRCHAPRDPSVPRPTNIRSTLPRVTPPSQWDWGNVSGIDYLTQVKNQHIPVYCGSCWAQAATSSLSDRIKIARAGKWPDINIAPQVLISCGPGDGCHGGDAGAANEWIAKNGITDETCSIYRARGHDNGAPCNRLEICESCSPGSDTCFTPQKYFKYRVDEYADVEGNTPKSQEENMMMEIYHRGPISCGLAVTDALLNYTGGIFRDVTGTMDIDHDISVVGYGVENGVKYWKIRNSWGTYWGEKGFFRLIRGINNIGIESGTCSWATPLKTWDDNSFVPKTESSQPRGSTASLSMLDKLWDILYDIINTATKKRHSRCRVEKTYFKNGPRILSPEPTYIVKSSSLPKEWDWRNVKGINYLSWTVNQHIPVYCGSCWAQGTLSALADRFIIGNRNKYDNLALSVQMIINCEAGGTCEGGNPGGVYEFAHTTGVPDMTCQVYEARNNGPVDDCSKPDINVCRNCKWPPPKLGESGNCWAQQEFRRYYAEEYGTIQGAENMKKEIWKRGPIGCGVDVTAKFDRYQGGIYSEHVDSPMINHEISVVGWGVDSESGKEYWIGRNSWGTYWGEYGFFRIEMHQNNLGIETDCVWATPKLH